MSDSTGRNAYELRSDILSMAIGILESKKQREAENEYMKADAAERSAVDPYTVSEVLDVANQLNGFVAGSK